MVNTMKANLSFEQYESMRDATDVSKATQAALEGDEKAVQQEWADHVQETTYGPFKDGFDCPARDYRENFGWEFEAFDSYALVSEADISQISGDLTDELPRDGERAMNKDADRGDYDYYRIPVVNGESLPIQVTTESELEEAKSLLDEFMDACGLSNSSGNTDSSAQHDSYDGPFSPIDGIGQTKGEKLQNDPRAVWLTEDDVLSQLSDEEQDRVEQLTEQADMDLLNAVSIDVSVEASPMSEDEMLDMLPDSERDMAETLMENGHEVSEVLESFL